MTREGGPIGDETTRRRFLLASGFTGSVVLAGCVWGDDTDDGRVAPGEAGDAPEPTETGMDHDDDVPEPVRDWLDQTNIYDGSVTDRTDEDSILISVGAGEDGLGFLPAMARVDVGTTVEWAWTGAGGDHNVAHSVDGTHNVDITADEPLFFSGEPIDSATESFEFTFEETGLYPYVCDPHWAAGMRGVIEVV